MSESESEASVVLHDPEDGIPVNVYGSPIYQPQSVEHATSDAVTDDHRTQVKLLFARLSVYTLFHAPFSYVKVLFISSFVVVKIPVALDLEERSEVVLAGTKGFLVVKGVYVEQKRKLVDTNKKPKKRETLLQEKMRLSATRLP